MEKHQAISRPQYRRTVELGLIISLFIHIGIMQAYKKLDYVESEKRVIPADLIVENTQRTEIKTTAPAPRLPSVPVASESEDIPDIAYWDAPVIEMLELPPMPVMVDQGEAFQDFVAFDESPSPVGGWAEFMAQVRYPEMARKAGVEGEVIVLAYISRSGKVVRAEIERHVAGCDQAALDAVLKTAWHPAKQREEPVSVKVRIPVRFTLK